MRQKAMPDFSIEQQYAGVICGVDEAGRGPLAGPVVAAAVILDRYHVPAGIHDSKKLSKAKRDALINDIKQHSRWAIGSASVEEIDALNILQATKLAMKRAVEGLAQSPDVALVDGNQPPRLSCKAVCVVKGDSLSLSIAAASIIAKVTRDEMMEDLGNQYPNYGFEKHAGYGTASHMAALATYGACAAHRKTFRPVAAAIAKMQAEAA
jgi:ribonuclease HII